MRILYFGMYGEFSLIPLQALVAAGIQICGVVVPSSAAEATSSQTLLPLPPSRRLVSELPVLNRKSTTNIVQLAWDHHIPAFELTEPDSDEALDAIRALQPHVALVVCFPWLFPESLLEIPHHGFLNLHPSLLPRFRGPEPLFWIFHQGENSTGVTLHYLDSGMDSGPIALQAPMTLPDGISGYAAERQLATLGGELLVQAIQQMQLDELPSIPQSSEGSYFPSPTPADFRISTSWPAQRAFNFMRGTEQWSQPYPMVVGSTRLGLRSALSFRSEGNLSKPLAQRGREVSIQMSPGVLNAVRW